MPPVDIKAIREHLKYNLVEFAELICIPATTLSGMERGTIQPRRKVIDNIVARFPEIDVERFTRQKKAVSPTNSNSALKDLIELYREKDRELTESKEEISTLLREIICLKDQLLQQQSLVNGDAQTAPRMLLRN